MELGGRGFDFSQFLTDYNDKSTVQKICDPNFQKLREKYQQNLQTITADPQVMLDLKNRTITALFLDKVSKSPHLPEELEIVKKYEYSSSTINSIHLIEYLEKISTDPRLDLTTQKTIGDWVQTEKEYLELAIIIDGWRIQDPAMAEVLAGKITNIREMKFAIAKRLKICFEKAFVITFANFISPILNKSPALRYRRYSPAMVSLTVHGSFEDISSSPSLFILL
jgi:hypothetical protein